MNPVYVISVPLTNLYRAIGDNIVETILILYKI